MTERLDKLPTMPLERLTTNRIRFPRRVPNQQFVASSGQDPHGERAMHVFGALTRTLTQLGRACTLPEPTVYSYHNIPNNGNA
jgi:hypothetical protein